MLFTASWRNNASFLSLSFFSAVSIKYSNVLKGHRVSTNNANHFRFCKNHNNCLPTYVCENYSFQVTLVFKLF